MNSLNYLIKLMLRGYHVATKKKKKMYNENIYFFFFFRHSTWDILLDSSISSFIVLIHIYLSVDT